MVRVCVRVLGDVPPAARDTAQLEGTSSRISKYQTRVKRRHLQPTVNVYDLVQDVGDTTRRCRWNGWEDRGALSMQDPNAAHLG